jgi:hypothetical protein
MAKLARGERRVPIMLGPCTEVGVVLTLWPCRRLSNVAASKSIAVVVRVWCGSEFAPRSFPLVVVAITGQAHGCMSWIGNGQVQKMRDVLLSFEPGQAPLTNTTCEARAISKRPVDAKGTAAGWSATALHTPDQPAGRNSPRFSNGRL